MDIQAITAKIDELADRIKGDGDLQKSFREDPVRAVEKLLGVDLPDDLMEKVVSGVQAKLKLDGPGGVLGSLLGKK